MGSVGYFLTQMVLDMELTVAKPKLSKEFLHSILRYDQENGKFFWKCDRGANKKVHAGDETGKKRSSEKAYPTVKIDDIHYLCHRLAWVMTHGYWPIGDLDHINNDICDYRISNLREATRSQNKFNHPARKDSESQCRGVTKRPKGNYQVRLTINGYRKHIGCFDDLELASFVYEETARKHHGDFAYLRPAA